MSKSNKALDLDTLILHYGVHRTREEGLSALEAEAWLAGEEHADRPACVCPVIAAFVRRWNDGFSDDAERTRALVPLLRERVMSGTRSTPAVQRARAWLAVDWALRRQTPALLRALEIDEEAAAQLEQLPACTSRQTAEPARALLREVVGRARARQDEAFARREEYRARLLFAAAADADAAGDAAAAAANAAANAVVVYDAADAAVVVYDAADAAYAAEWKYMMEVTAKRTIAGAKVGRRLRERLALVLDATHASAQDLVRSMAAIREVQS